MLLNAPVKYLCTVSPLCEGKCRERNTEHGEVCCSECYTEEEERRFRARQRRSEGRDDKDRDDE
jgi:hypothetical protein